MKKLLIATIAAAAVSAAMPTLAASDAAKIGVVNVAQILAKSPQVAADKAALKKQYQPQLEKIQAAEKTLQANVEQLKKDGVTMQASDRKALQDKIGQQQQDLFQQQQSFQQAVTDARQKDMQALLNQLQATIQAVAQKQGYSLVLPKGGVAYADDSMDITSAVETAFDKAMSDK